MIFSLSIFVKTAKSACSNNLLRDVYLSSKFVLPSQQDSASNISYINVHLNSKVSEFVTQSPALDNWCTNNSDIFITTPNEFCCSTNKVNQIAWQFAAKYIVGAGSLFQNSIKAFSHFNKTCIPLTNANYSKLSDLYTNASFNATIWRLLYSVYKAIISVQPVSQTYTCLICASDATISQYVSSTNVFIRSADFTTLVNSYGKALFDFNQAFQSLLGALASFYANNIIDKETSPATCLTQVSFAPGYARFCGDLANCTALSALILANSALDYESLQNYINKKETNISTRVLTSRAMASVGNSVGAGSSKYQGITAAVSVNGANSKQFAQLFGGWVLPVFAFLLASS